MLLQIVKHVVPGSHKTEIATRLKSLSCRNPRTVLQIARHTSVRRRLIFDYALSFAYPFSIQFQSKKGRYEKYHPDCFQYCSVQPLSVDKRAGRPAPEIQVHRGGAVERDHRLLERRAHAFRA